MATTTIHTHETVGEVNHSWDRIAGIAGVVFVVLFLVFGASIASGAPTFTDGADEIRTWFGDNTGPIALFTWVATIFGGPLFLTFAIGLRNRLASVDTSGGLLPQLAYSGALAGFASRVVAVGFWGVLAIDEVLDTASDGLLVTLTALDSVVFFVAGPWTEALFVVAASLVMMRSKIMPVWLGALGCVASAVAVVGTLWILSGDPTGVLGTLTFAGGFGTLLWMLITSVFMIRSRQS